MGTANYMSPEQVRTAPDLDGRSDLFSVGLILYELVTGERAYRAESLIAVLYKIANEDPDLRLLPSGPAWDRLRAALVRALAKDPRARYPDARSMADDLTAALGDLGGRYDPHGAADSILRFAKGSRAPSPSPVEAPRSGDSRRAGLPAPSGARGARDLRGGSAPKAPPASTCRKARTRSRRGLAMGLGAAALAAGGAALVILLRGGAASAPPPVAPRSGAPTPSTVVAPAAAPPADPRPPWRPRPCPCRQPCRPSPHRRPLLPWRSHRRLRPPRDRPTPHRHRPHSRRPPPHLRGRARRPRCSRPRPRAPRHPIRARPTQRGSSAPTRSSSVASTPAAAAEARAVLARDSGNAHAREVLEDVEVELAALGALRARPRGARAWRPRGGPGRGTARPQPQADRRPPDGALARAAALRPCRPRTAGVPLGAASSEGTAPRMSSK